MCLIVFLAFHCKILLADTISPCAFHCARIIINTKPINTKIFLILAEAN